MVSKTSPCFFGFIAVIVPDIENIEPCHWFQTIVTVQWFQTAKRHVTNVKKLAKMFALGA